MVSVGSITASLDLDNAKFNAKLKDSISGLKRFESAARGVAIKAGAAFAAMGAGIFAAAKAADVQARAMARLAAVSRATGIVTADGVRRLQEQAAALQRTTTFGDEATIAMQAQLVAMRLTEKQVSTLTPLVQDLAAASGMDLNNASILVGRSLTSGTNVLQRYGVVLTDAQKELFKTGNESQRLAILTNALSASVGGAAGEMARTSVGAMAQLKNAIGDTLEEVGFLVDSPLAEFLRFVTEQVQRATTWFANLSPGVKEFAGRAILATTAILGIVSALAGIASLVPFIVAGFKLMAIGVLAFASPLFATIAVVVALVALAAVLRDAWERNLGGIRERVAAFADGVRSAFSVVVAWLGRLITSAESAITAMVTFLGRAIAIVPRLWLSAISLVLSALERLLQAGAAAAEALGFGETAAKIRGAAGAIAGFRAGVETFSASIDEGVESIAKTLNPITVLKTAATFWTGDGPSKAGAIIGEGLTTAGESIQRGLGLIVRDIFGAGGEAARAAAAGQVAVPGGGGRGAGGAAAETFVGAVPRLGEDALKLSEFQSQLRRGIGNAAERAVRGAGPDSLESFFSTAIRDVLKDATRGIRTDPAAKDALAKALGGLLSDALTGAGVSAAGLVGAGAGAAATLGGAGAGVAGIVGEFMQGAVTTIADTLKQGVELAAAAFGRIVQDSRLGRALQESTTGLAEFVTKLVPVVLVIAALVSSLMILPVITAAAALLPLAFNQFLFSLTQSTESFQAFQRGMSAVTDRIVEALEPFFRPLIALVGLFDAFVDVLLPVINAFANTETIARVLFEVFKAIAIAVGFLFIAFGFLNNVTLFLGFQMLEVVRFLLGAVGLLTDEMTTAILAWQDSLLRSQVNIDAMADAMGDLQRLTFEEATARGRSLAMLEKAAAATSESLLNVPEGFKVARARLEAQDAVNVDVGATAVAAGAAVGASAAAGGGGGSQIVINIDELNALARDPIAFIRDLLEQLGLDRFLSTGSTQTDSEFSRPGG